MMEYIVRERLLFNTIEKYTGCKVVYHKYFSFVIACNFCLVLFNMSVNTKPELEYGASC